MGNGATRYKSKILKIYFFNDFMQKLIKQVVSKMLIGSISWRKFVISTQGFFIFLVLKFHGANGQNVAMLFSKGSRV